MLKALEFHYKLIIMNEDIYTDATTNIDYI